MNSRSIRRLMCLLAAAAFLMPVSISLTACNTVEGAGEDLQQGSENTREAIDDATD